MKKFIILTSLAILALVSCKKENQDAVLESISFKKSSYTIEENYLDLNLKKELVTTPASIIEKEKIKWDVDDETIAEMTGNFLTPKRSGNVNVTATIQGKSAKCEIVITPVPIEKITLQNTTVVLYGVAEVPAEITPSGINRERLTWSSSDNTIATIDENGVVKGEKVGTVTITATGDGQEGTCTVTVEKIPVEKVILSEKEITFYSIGESKQLEVTWEPENASEPKAAWKSSNISFATVDDGGTVTAKGYGTATITVTVDGKSETCEVSTVRTITDCQGNRYPVVKIGDNWWMAENLKCTKYDTQSERAGVELNNSITPGYGPLYASPSVDHDDWADTHYSDSEREKAGYLYTWAAAMGLASGEEARQDKSYSSRQGICPNNWHLPTGSDVLALIVAIGENTASYSEGYTLSNMSKKLKSDFGWYYYTQRHHGTDEYGFCAVPVGSWQGTKYVHHLTYEAYFWTITNDGTDYAWVINLVKDDEAYWTKAKKEYGMSIRCVQD